MSDQVSVNFVTYDPQRDEFVLYFVDDGPWPQSEGDWHRHLRSLQDKILAAVDASVDGGLAKQYANSIGKKVRIQVDSP